MHPLWQRSAVLLLLFIPNLLSAATYIVPPDAEMIQRSDDIVVATGVTSTVERNARGAIVTRYYLRVEEVLKGQRSAGSHLVLTEAGGRLGDRLSVMSGMPVYVPGERYLVFTETNRDGEPLTFGLELGRFWFEKDDRGRVLAVRSPLCGFDQNLEPFREPMRDAAGFMQYVRGIVRQQIDPVPTWYAGPARPAESERHIGRFGVVENEDLDLAGAVSAGRAAWNSAGAGISYTDGGEDLTALGGLSDHDGKNTVLFNDPNGELGTGVGGRGGVTRAVGTYDLDGETFFKTIEVDVVINDRFWPSLNTCLRSVVGHELGHTLSIRHSDAGPTGGTCNPATAECSSSALMKAVTSCTFDGALQTWDTNAARSVYGSGPRPFSRRTYLFVDARWQTPSASIIRNPSPPCTPVSIATHPQDRTITQGQTTSLGVTASGTGPLVWQWFIGNPPDTSNPTGQSTGTIEVSPQVTTNYWVRVAGQCDPAANSNAATVTVTTSVCPDLTVRNPTAAKQPDGSYLLDVVAGGGSGVLTFQWFRGAVPGAGDFVGTGRPFSVPAPAAPASYWVRVISGCDKRADSPVAVTIGSDIRVNDTEPGDRRRRRDS